MAQVEIKIPVEYKALYEDGWRYVVYYGGRYCFAGGTIISMYDGTFKPIKDIKVGDRVLSWGGDSDIISDVTKFIASVDPKPMLELEINGVITNVTYDHKYFNGKGFIPIYQLVWRGMDTTQRRKLELLCKQYGSDTHNEIQGWIQNQSNETSDQQKWLSNDGGRREVGNTTQTYSKDFYKEPDEEGDRKPHQRREDRQQNRKLGVGNTLGAVTPPVEDWVTERQCYTGTELQKDVRGTSKRIVAVSYRQSDNATEADVEAYVRKDGFEIRWDTRFAEWANMETHTATVPIQKDDITRSESLYVRVVRVYESTDVWSITTEKYNSYFANGVYVSNSLKSYNVALSQLIRGRQKKMRFLDTREIQNSIKDSVHKLLADQIERYGFTDYEVTNDTIRNKVTGTEFIFRGLRHNINEIKSMEGIDEAWIEEGHSVTKQSLDILLPTIRKAGSRIVVTFNRVTELDPVYVKFVQEPQEKCYTKNLNYDIAEKYGLMTDAIRQEIEHDKKTDPALYAHKWLGQPLAQTDNAILNRDAVIEAMSRKADTDGAVEIGVDVARYGSDRSTFYKRKGLGLVDSREYTKLALTELATKLETFADFNKDIRIKIDDTGIGGGLTDIMKERGYNVVPINFGASASDKDKYTNLISEAWFYIQSIIKDISIPQDNDLLMELTTRRWKMDSRGRRAVESKDDYKKRGYRSPDKADGLILAYYNPVEQVVEWATADELL